MGVTLKFNPLHGDLFCKKKLMQFFNPSHAGIILGNIKLIMVADGLMTQGTRSSATMMLTMLNWINSVPAC